MKPLLNRLSDPVKYGLTAFAVIWFVGLVLQQGSFLANLIFSALMGLLAGTLFWLIQRYHRNRQ